MADQEINKDELFKQFLSEGSVNNDDQNLDNEENQDNTDNEENKDDLNNQSTDDKNLENKDPAQDDGNPNPENDDSTPPVKDDKKGEEEKPLTMEEIKKQFQEEMQKENQKRELENLKKEKADRDARERAEREAEERKKQEADKSWTPDNLLTEEDKKVIKYIEDSEKGFPEVAKYVKIREKQLREEQQRFLKSAFSEYHQFLNEQMAPLVQAFGDLQKEKHFSKIKSVHSDFDTHVEGLTQWVEKQPAKMRESFRSVLEEGSAEDTIELLNMYKHYNGLNKQEQQSSQSNQNGKSAEEIELEKRIAKLKEEEAKIKEEFERKKKAAALAAPPSGRNTQIDTTNRNGNKSRDDLFKEFLK